MGTKDWGEAAMGGHVCEISNDRHASGRAGVRCRCKESTDKGVKDKVRVRDRGDGLTVKRTHLVVGVESVWAQRIQHELTELW